MGPKRWQDWTNGILGLWLFVSPWVLGFATYGGAPAPTAWMLGVAIVVFAAIAVSIPKPWEEALTVVLGICLFISPWALRYTDASKATTNAIIIGLLVTLFAVWAMVMDTTVQKWWHERRPMW